MANHVIYHWKHGYIPLDHAAALSKAHGSQTGAAKIMARHGIAQKDNNPHSIPSADLRRADHVSANRAPNDQVALHDAQTGKSFTMTASGASALHNNGHTITGVGDGRVRTKNGAGGPEVDRDASARMILKSQVNDGERAPRAITEDYGVSYENAKRNLSSGWSVYHIGSGKELGGGHARYSSKDQAVHRAREAQVSADEKRTSERRVPSTNSEKIAEAKPSQVRPMQGQVATEAQVGAIIRLQSRRARNGDGDGFMTGRALTADQIRKMTRAKASQYITSLTGDY